MKNFKSVNWFFLKIIFAFLLTSQFYFSYGTIYTWDGSSSTLWNDQDNWTPAGVPGTDVSDEVIINATGTGNPEVNLNVTIAKITFNTKTLTLNASTNLTVTGTATMTNGTLTGAGTLLFTGTSISIMAGTFSAAQLNIGTPSTPVNSCIIGNTTAGPVISSQTYIHTIAIDLIRTVFSSTTATVDIKTSLTANSVRTGSNTFNGPTTLEAAGTGYWNVSSIVGGCTYNNEVNFICSSGRLYIGSHFGDNFNATGVAIYTILGDGTNNGSIYASTRGATIMDRDIEVNSTSTGIIVFGNGEGTTALADGKKLRIGTTPGFISGNLQVSNIIFPLGSDTEQTFTFDPAGTASLILYNNVFEGKVTASVPQLSFTNCHFKDDVEFTKVGAGTNASGGGNTFDGEFKLTLTSTSGQLRTGLNNPDWWKGDAYFYNGSPTILHVAWNSNENKFDGNVVFENASSSSIYVSNSTTSKVSFTGADKTVTFKNTGSESNGIIIAGNFGEINFSGNVQVESNNTATGAGISFGYSEGSKVFLASGKSLSIGPSGFNTGYLQVNRLIQSGNEPFNLGVIRTLTFGPGNVINGDMTLTALAVYFTGGNYYGTVEANSTGWGGEWRGEVTFHNDVVLNYSGNGTHFVSTLPTDVIKFKDNVTFNKNSTSFICVGRSGITEFYKNLTFNINHSGNYNYEFGYSGGLCIFTDEHPQVISSNKPELKFSKIEINKLENSVTLNTTVRMVPFLPGSPTPELTLTSGNIISSDPNFLILSDGTVVTGGSASSFVSGPVKKIGDDAFIFPIGKGAQYRPLAITAPSQASHEFLAEYFNSVPPHASNVSGFVLSDCEHWNLQRTSGTSNVKASLDWNSSSCQPVQVSLLKLARYDSPSGVWVAEAASTGGDNSSGSIQSDNDLNNPGLLTLAHNCQLALAANVTHSCFGSEGSIDLTVIGGTAPYSYDWSNDATTQDIFGLTPLL